jgi:sterol desaturase/sphingolipid hydroxylase (fatty acid hydroxylase superfamily)
MPYVSLRRRLADELMSPPDERRFGSGWLSGASALGLGLAGLFVVVCLHYPSLLTVPQLRFIGSFSWFRPLLDAGLVVAYALALLSLILRQDKLLGFTAIGVVIVAALMGGGASRPETAEGGSIYFGLDFFVVNVVFTGFLFVPLERLMPRIKGQPLFRSEWHEDLFYYLVSSLFVQILTFLTLAPSNFILGHAQLDGVRAAVAGQPFWLQVVEIMALTDFAQYWLHRAFHRVPMFWRFHAVHHSAQTMDWVAGARMHFLEIVCLRAVTATPAFAVGFAPAALQAYLLIVYVYSTFIHANFGWNFDRIGAWLVTPRFHHWHHGVDREAIDVNFAIHFPLYDRLFGTYHLPKGEWPSGYGVVGNPVPRGYWRQFLYPFRRD